MWKTIRWGQACIFFKLGTLLCSDMLRRVTWYILTVVSERNASYVTILYLKQQTQIYTQSNKKTYNNQQNRTNNKEIYIQVTNPNDAYK